MALTLEGLTIKRFPEILEELNQELKSTLNTDIDTSEISVAGVLNSLVANTSSDLWELSQSVYDSFDVLRAGGDALENLALLNGFTRRSATSTKGVARFTGANGTVIPIGSEAVSIRNEVFTNPNVVNIASIASVEEKLKVIVVADSSLYRVTIEGNVFDFTSGVSASLQDILTGINLVFTNAGSGFSHSIVTDSSDLTDKDTNYIQIDKDDKTSAYNVTSSSYIIFEDVVSLSILEAKETGFVPADQGTINTIATPINGWTGVFNPTDFALGDNKETDEELRFRIQHGFETVGSGTPDTIVSRLLEIDDVEAVILIENTAIVADGVTGLPPVSYELVIEGGNSQSLGDEIWKTKPAGIQIYENLPSGTSVEVDVIDINSKSQKVHFTRPTPQYAFMRVSYDNFDEEVQPANIDLIIKEVCLAYGENLSIGDDIIPQRFIGEIYRNVAGIENISVEIDIDPLANPSPNPPVYPGAWSPDRITIDFREVSSFAINRMSIV